MDYRTFFSVAAVALATSICLFRCSDYAELPHTFENLNGTWRVVHGEGWNDSYGCKCTWTIDYRFDEPDGYYETLAFRADSVCVAAEGRGEDVMNTRRLECSISGDTLTMLDPLVSWTYYRIEKLTRSQLVLVEQLEGDTGALESSMTYERMQNY